MNEFYKKMDLINKEDIVWITYLVIVIFALYTNRLEKENLIKSNKGKEQIAKNINTIILVVAFFIYLYFTYVSLKQCNEIKNKKNLKDLRVSTERLVVNILFLIAGAIAIYADYDSNNSPDIAIL